MSLNPAQIDQRSLDNWLRLERLERNIEAIRYIGESLSTTISIEKLLPLIISEVSKIMNAERSTLYIVDHKTHEIWSKIAERSELQEIRLKMGVGISGWVAENGQILNIDDVYSDSRFDQTTDKKTGFKTTSALTAPIFSPDIEQKTKNVIAVIQILNKKNGRPFDTDDETMLQSLASQISIALMNANLYEQLDSKISELDFLYALEKNVSTSTNNSDLLNELTEKLVHYLGAEAGSLFMINQDQHFLYFKVATGEHTDYLKSLKLRIDHGLVGWVINNKESLFVNDVIKDERFNTKIAEDTSYFPTSIICAPLISNGEVIGAIELINKSSANKLFKKSDLQILEFFSGHITRIIETINFREQKVKEDQLSAIGKMISTIVHDIRQPMSNIMGFSELLKDEHVTIDERKEYIGIIIKQVNNLHSMTNEILDFAKGKSSILARKTSVKELLNNYSALVVRDLENQKVKFIAEYNIESRVNFHADEAKLLRVFLNLQKNALEAMEQENKEFSVNVTLDNGLICFAFKDNGPGIPDSIKDRLFDSFVTSGKEHGTGLGLAICKKIVEDHHGFIKVETSPKGTCFKLFFKVLT
jgi:signal transduction histidine kinase